MQIYYLSVLKHLYWCNRTRMPNRIRYRNKVFLNILKF